jgi:hypothetical protein
MIVAMSTAFFIVGLIIGFIIGVIFAAVLLTKEHNRQIRKAYSSRFTVKK